jgi:hypothetical protein
LVGALYPSTLFLDTDEWLQHAADYAGEAQRLIGGNKADTGLVPACHGPVAHRRVQIGKITTPEISDLILVSAFEYQRQFTASVGVLRDSDTGRNREQTDAAIAAVYIVEQVMTYPGCQTAPAYGIESTLKKRKQHTWKHFIGCDGSGRSAWLFAAV